MKPSVLCGQKRAWMLCAAFYSLFFFKSSASLAQTPHPSLFYAGKVTPATKMMDCDEMGIFSRGAAIIKKGDAYALIDAQGQIIVPFNTYELIFNEGFHYSSNGIFYASYKDKNISPVYINSKGKVICDFGKKDGYDIAFSDNGEFLVLRKSNAAVILIDHDGKRMPITLQGSILGERRVNGVRDSAIVYAYTVNNKRFFGFKNLWGGGAQGFDKLEPFYCGIAVFGKKNEFGDMKYGFIDRDGKIIVPARFSLPPEKFTHGISRVRASKEAGFDWAFFNTKGDIIYTSTPENKRKYGLFSDFYADYAYSGTGTYMMTKTGEISTQSDFFRRLMGNNKIGDPILTTPMLDIRDGNQRFTLSAGSSPLKKEYDGLYNPATGIVLIAEPALNLHMTERFMFFDEVSQLAYAAVLSAEKDRNGRHLKLEGYINPKGEYVLLKGKPKSDW